MTTILTKKKDTTGAPAPGDLTNSAGGAELAVNTFDKRLYTKDAGGNVVEIGTNPSTIDTTTVDTTNLEVTNIKAKDGTAAATIANSTGKITVSTELAVDNLNLSGNTISSTDTNGNIVLAPNGTGQLVVNAGTVGAPTISPTGDLNTGIYFPAADTIAFTEGGVESMRINSSGNLSIGTTAANGKITIAGNPESIRAISDNAFISFYNDANAARSGLIQGSNVGMFITVDVAQPLVLSTSGIERMRITSIGDVAIGATSTSSRLLAASSINYNESVVTGAASGFLINNAGQEIAMGGSGNSPFPNYIQSRTSGVAWPLILNPLGGNIGIGTNSPNGRVTIGANANDNVLTGTSNTQGLHLYHRSFGVSQIDSLVNGSSNSGMSLRTYNNGTYTEFIANFQGNTTTFQTAGTERMRITSAGNVGIGTSSPDFLLEIKSNNTPSQGLKIWGASPDGTKNSNIYFGDNNGTNSYVMRFVNIFGGGSGEAYGLNLRSLNTSADLTVIGGTEASPVTGLTFKATNGNLGIGTNNPASKLTVNGGNTRTVTIASDGTSGYELFDSPSGGNHIGSMTRRGNGIAIASFEFLAFYTAATTGISSGSERMRITSGGDVGIGTSSPGVKLEVSVNTTNAAAARITNSSQTDQYLQMSMMGSSGFTVPGWDQSAVIEAVQLAVGSGTRALYLSAYSGPMIFATNGRTERMRILSTGQVLIGKTADNFATAGVNINPTGECQFTRSGAAPLLVNRTTNDGDLVIFYQDGAGEGSISVSGTTVSYNGGHLARWSQLPDNTKDDTILKGTVLTNLDDMCVWTKDGEQLPNEQLNKMKVSDVEGDTNVAGVFVNWTRDEDCNSDDMNIAMTGDMIIRIADGVVVQKGDLLMSAGDGTAKPQGDDIVRSKTIAKVTSNYVTCTYADGSYCVPCVLMAC
jgi:hypothetical protein